MTQNIKEFVFTRQSAHTTRVGAVCQRDSTSQNPPGHGLQLKSPVCVPGMESAFCNTLVALINLTSGYHPQSNGQTERCNQELKAALRCIINNNPTSWSTHFTWIKYSAIYFLSLCRIPIIFVLQLGITFLFPLFNVTSDAAEVSDVRPKLPFTALLIKVKEWHIKADFLLPNVRLDKRYGFPPMI